jgi:hypothetical protein
MVSETPIHKAQQRAFEKSRPTAEEAWIKYSDQFFIDSIPEGMKEAFIAGWEANS